MNYGEALEFIKRGGVARRKDWQPQQIIYLQQGSHDGALKGHKRLAAVLNAELFQTGDKGTVTRLPNINMKTPAGETLTGFNPSQLDQLAEDWEIVDNG
ncbi:hypothetical protein B9J07_27640 [Sinorhizobium sp. LM21]|uniref:Thoeris anti-defense Tad2 family protein n=1 Tax=Sinorhizobium sp. LM21 TaxID=1449788 RepID=UPI0005DA58B4|nr:MW1434 family type I TA system toxin [Sinorhizobium sp. LM21]AJW30230.1 hypothetical protein pLM21S1_p112 [Sinorhizobium sp. LM21]OWZ90364.1 hypothetical protein B9J07_27640 [Sinorhizobium sp. LM21]